MIEEKYATGWLRFKASIVDSALVSIVSVGLYWSMGLVAPKESPVFVAGVAVLLVAPFLYSIACHALSGKTFGKHLYGLMVLRNGTEGRLSWSRALGRDAVPLALQCGLVAALLFRLGGDSLAAAFKSDRNAAEIPGEALLATLSLFWSLAEIVTMFFNDKRRALHDYLAGSVVVRKEAQYDDSIRYFWALVIVNAVLRSLLRW